MDDQPPPPARRLDGLVARQARIALIEGSRDVHAQVGRGVVVRLLEDTEPRFVPIEEAKARLLEERADPGLLTALLVAVGKYDTTWQAVLLLELAECSIVAILSYDKIEVVWSASWTATH